MIIYFALTNFKSFKERFELNMIAGNYKRFSEHVITSTVPNLLRTTAIYGNNAAGKSNLIIGLEMLRDIVLGRTIIETQNDLPYFKLEEKYKEMPTVFEIEFFHNNVRYSYYLSFIKGRINKEWLEKVIYPNKSESIFHRYDDDTGETILTIGNKDRSSRKDKIRAEIYAEELSKKGNKPFLLDAYEKELEIVSDAFDWFYSFLQIVRANYYYTFKVPMFEEEYVMRLAKQILIALNLGIVDLKIEKIAADDFFGKSDLPLKLELIEELNLDEDKSPIIFEKNNIEYTFSLGDDTYYVSRIMTLHEGSETGITFELSEESAGTQRIIEILPSLIISILKGVVYVFDEIERSVHPSIIRKLLEIFLTAGDFPGQLIFSTHECNLLDLNLLRQDEIWFVEKDKSGMSHLYSLSDFKPRFDKDVRKGYLEGQFSEMPFFTEPEKLNWNEYTEKVKE